MTLDESRVETLVERVLRRLEGDAAHSGIARPAVSASARGTGPVFETPDDAAREAQRAFRDLGETSLEVRDRMIAAIRRAVEEHAPELARLAVEETGLGRVDDKIKKNLLVGRKTPGTEDLAPTARSGDHGLTLEERAPYGVILSVTPSTNPSETVINNGIGMLAGGNAVIFAPHPSAARVSLRAIEILERAAREAGGPANVFTTIAKPSIEATQALMRHDAVRLLVVTGGAGVVKEAMSVGKRAITAGPGNPPVVVDATADLGPRRARHRGRRFARQQHRVHRREGSDRGGQHRGRAHDAPGARRSVSPARPRARFGAQGSAPRGSRAAAAQHSEQGADRQGRGRHLGGGGSFRTEHDAASRRRGRRRPSVPVDRAHDAGDRRGLRPATSTPRSTSRKDVEGGNRHTAAMYSHDVTKLSRMARTIDCSIFVKNGPTFNGLGEGGEGFTSYTIASPTGEGMTTARSFTRFRRCTLVDSFRIV